jgi:hypothetical protein
MRKENYNQNRVILIIIYNSWDIIQMLTFFNFLCGINKANFQYTCNTIKSRPFGSTRPKTYTDQFLTILGTKLTNSMELSTTREATSCEAIR